MSDFWEVALAGALCGFLAGQLFTRWAINGYYASKVPDAAGSRTGIFIKGRMYYLVTGDEYIEKVNKLEENR
jgi:hypothetical protein